jgi:hypothetical protein
MGVDGPMIATDWLRRVLISGLLINADLYKLCRAADGVNAQAEV